jgi:hypothetical protein
MKVRLLCGTICLLVWVGSSDASLLAYEFQPASAAVDNLDGSISFAGKAGRGPSHGEPATANLAQIGKLPDAAIVFEVHLLDCDSPMAKKTAGARSGGRISGQEILMSAFPELGTQDPHSAVDWISGISLHDSVGPKTCSGTGGFGVGSAPHGGHSSDVGDLRPVSDHTAEPAMLVLLGLPFCSGRRRMIAR